MTVIASEIARRLKIGLANPGAKIYRVLREGGMLTPEINWADLWHTAATPTDAAIEDLATRVVEDKRARRFTAKRESGSVIFLDRHRFQRKN
jgi:hypothetical protein